MTTFSQKIWLPLAIVLLLSLVLRFYNLSYPANQYFDEVYYSYTAQKYLHNNPTGYEYWASSDEGFANEWTHPPVTKLIIAGGMAVFGENSFGWRWLSALAGTLVVLLTYLITQKLFKKRTLSILATFLVCIEGLNISQSRIAMGDIFFTLFYLSTIYFYISFRQLLRQNKFSFVRILLMALFLGLSISTKWTGFYIIPVILFDLFIYIIRNFKNKSIPVVKIILASCFTFITVALIYLASYSQFFLLKHTIKQFIETQQQMWWYHTGLKATHPYQSLPWQWLLNLKPVWLHVDYTNPAKIINFYNIGNTTLYLTGILSFIYFIISVLKKYSWPKQIIFFSYSFIFLPWVISPRINFFYHYLPATPFLCIAAAYLIYYLYLNKNKMYSRISLAILFFILLNFLLVLPLNLGLALPKNNLSQNYVRYLTNDFSK